MTITARLSGTVTVAQSHKTDGYGGHDQYFTANTVKKTVEASASIEFPYGHVNIEGYVLSKYYNDEYDMLLSFCVDENPALEDWRILEDATDLSVELYGEWWDWIQQAHRYQTERPSKSILDCLSQFRSWEETNDDALHGAINRAKEATGLVKTDCRDLSDRDHETLRDALNDLENVEIPESYARDTAEE